MATKVTLLEHSKLTPSLPQCAVPHLRNLMHYDPSRYLPGDEAQHEAEKPLAAVVTPPLRPRRYVVADRWKSEFQRAFTPPVPIRGESPASRRCDDLISPTLASPAPPAPAAPPAKPTTASGLVAEVAACPKCCERRHSPAQPAEAMKAAYGLVAVQRPPLLAYNLATHHVPVPRAVKPHDGCCATARPKSGAAAAKRSKQRSQPCVFCEHDANHRSSANDTVSAVRVGERRQALVHQRHHCSRAADGNEKQKPSETAASPAGESSSSSTFVAPTAIPTSARVVDLDRDALLLATNLRMCRDCGRVWRTNPALPEGSACTACGSNEGGLRLFAEDVRRSSQAPLPAEASQDSSLQPVLDTVALLPRGVVPMTDRRTALGEKIRIGRARVSSPLQGVRITALDQPSTSSSLDLATKTLAQRWVTEPLSANDSLKAKLCLTWQE